MRPRQASTVSTALIAGFKFAGMADHVGVREIHDDGVEIAFANGVGDGIGDACGAHFRLQVVGGDFRRRDENAILAGKGFSTPPLKK